MRLVFGYRLVDQLREPNPALHRHVIDELQLRNGPQLERARELGTQKARCVLQRCGRVLGIWSGASEVT